MEDGTGESDEEQEYGGTQSRHRGWNRLKSKIHELRHRQSSVDSTDNTTGDGGISDFLYSTGQPPKDYPRLQPPQIDVSAAKATDEQEVGFEKFEYTKPPRAVGLKVAFVTTPPEVIGTGGEDSEEPVTAVSKPQHFEASNAPYRPPGQQLNPHSDAKNPIAPSYNPNSRPVGQTSHSKTEDPAANVRLSPHNKDLEHPSSGDSNFAQKTDVALSKTNSVMRADEGRAFLSASLGTGKGLRRKPVGSSDSESSRSRSPATSQHASPPPSRGSDDGILHAPQYPKALLPSHLQSSGWSPPKVTQQSQLRPSSSGSESNDRGRLRRMAPTNDLRSEKVNLPAPQHSASPTSHPLVTRDRIHATSFGAQGVADARISSNEHLGPPADPRSRSSSNRSLEGLEGENCVFRSRLQSLSVARASDIEDFAVANAQGMPWNRIHIFAMPQEEGRGGIATRIITFDDKSSFTDEYSRPGKFKLDQSNLTAVMLYRKQSSTAGISISPRVGDDFLLSQLKQVQTVFKEDSTSLAFNFHSNTEAHKFQEAITGYAVLYDGIAQHFSIARRRMMISIHKSYEAAGARIQVVQAQGRSHLIAFFSGYALADCLQLELKSFDVFEALESKDGRFLIKLVDAKFSLPGPKTEGRPQFISLDTPEPASEHEDVFIGFDDETARDEFGAALPADITGPRKFSLKRRI